MNVLHLDLGREMRGGQRQVLLLASHLDSRSSYRPIIACPKGAPLAARARKKGLEVVDLPGRRALNPLNILSVLKIVSNRQIALVHTHCARSAGLAALAKRFSRRGFFLIHTRRVSYPLGRGFSSRKYAAADKVAAVSRETGEVLEAGGLDPGKIVVIHSGIDVSAYPGKNEHPERDRVIIGAVGALTPQKGYEVFFTALRLLVQDTGLPDWRAWIAGDGPLKQDLSILAARLDLDGRICFLGYVDSALVLPDLDILVVPSVEGEGSNAVIKEGYAVGVPVIASDLASNLELVDPGRTALVFKNRDHESLAKVLSRLIRDPGLGATLALAGREKVREFSAEAMSEAYVRLYGEVLGPG